MSGERSPEYFEDHGLETTEVPRKKFVGVYFGGGRLSNREYKALIELGGLPTAAKIIGALDQVSSINRIVAIVPAVDYLQPFLAVNKPLHIIEASDLLIDNVQSAASAIQPEEHTVILLSDIPFVSPKSLEDLLRESSTHSITIPLILAVDVEMLEGLHNLHFYPSRDYGYFQLGNAAVIPSGVQSKVRANLERFSRYYRDKSFRGNFFGKLKMALELAGFLGVAVGVRVWVSANLQHAGYPRLDRVFLSPTLETYRNVINRIANTQTNLKHGPYKSMFLDIDYPEDLDLVRKNYELLRRLMEGG